MKLPNQSGGFSRSFGTQSVLSWKGTGIVPSAFIQRAAGGGAREAGGVSCHCPCCIITACDGGGECMYCC